MLISQRALESAQSGHSDARFWASECLHVKNYKLRFNPDWHIMNITACTISVKLSCLYLLNIWEFVYFVWDLSPPKRRVLNDGEILHAHAWRPCAGHVLGFMSGVVVITKIMTFFQKCVHIDLDFCCGDLRQRVGRWDHRQ